MDYRQKLAEECPACGTNFELNESNLISIFEDFRHTPGYSFVCFNCNHIVTKKGIDFKVRFEKLKN